MDPITVIVTALIAGAAAGGQEAASAAVRDAYLAIRSRISRGGGDAEATVAIEANEAEPGGDVAAIEAAVTRALVVDDVELRAWAARLLAAVPSAHVDRAQSRIDLSYAKGVQVGDDNTQHNTFH
ncbi:hypothetical protein [Nocardia sp. NPDC049707]|uniref:hypothetical protein n=1 Tax=Nocardia sp. NPDC049707 TaxID=3154735 RepID=UPI00344A3771